MGVMAFESGDADMSRACLIAADANCEFIYRNPASILEPPDKSGNPLRTQSVPPRYTLLLWDVHANRFHVDAGTRPILQRTEGQITEPADVVAAPWSMTDRRWSSR